MDTHYLFVNIPFAPDLNALEESYLFMGELDDPQVLDIWERCSRAARPRALLKQVDVLHDERGHVIAVGGQPMESTVLDRNLREVHRCFAYVATCGTELEALAAGLRDDARDAAYLFRMQALRAAIAYVKKQAQTLCGTDKLSAMNPGSLPEWPISHQRDLFAMLGDVEGSIGVHLKESMMMQPLESSSGLFFQSEQEFKNCMACTRKDCPGRQAPYNAALANEIRE